MKAVPIGRILMWILVVFALYAVYKAPAQAGHTTRAIIDGIVQAVRAVATFFDTLLRG